MTKLTTEQVKTAYKSMLLLNLTTMDVSGTNLVLVKNENGTIATYGSFRYKIQGEKRVKVDEIKEVVKAKKVKEVKPATTSVKCSKCGKMFDRSKFSPNKTECDVCCGSKKVHKEDVDKKCVKCGKTFKCSKFTPKKDMCADCVKLARKASNASKPKVTKPAKVKKIDTGKVGVPKIDLS